METNRSSIFKGLLTLVLNLAVFIHLLAQSDLSDSLRHMLTLEENPSLQLEIYHELLNDSTSDQLPSVFEWLQEYLRLSKVEKNVTSTADALYQHMRYYREINSLDLALAYGDSVAVLVGEETEKEVDLKIKTIEINYLLNKSMIFEARSSSEAAVDLNYEIFGLIEELENGHPGADLHGLRYSNFMAFGNHYLFLNDSLAYDYLRKAEAVARKMEDETRILSSINSSYYANYYSDNGPLLSSIADSCIVYAERIGDLERLGEAYMHKCNALVVMKKADEGEYFCELAIETFANFSDPLYLSSVMNNIANVLEKTDDPSRSLPYYEKSFELAKGIDNGTQYLTSLNNLAEKQLKLKRYKASAEHYKIYADSQKVYYENLISSQFAEAESKYQAGQKEVEIAKQNVKLTNERSLRNRITWAGITCLLLALGFFQWYRNRQKRKEIESNLILENQKKEARQLKELDKMKSQFFTNVSHELRTPLTLITGPLENIIEQNNSKSVASDLKLAHSNSKRLLTLINEILDLAKIESGKMNLNPTEAHIHPLINRIVHAFNSYAASKNVGLSLKNRVDEDLFIQIDKEKLETVINNLLSNAIKFSSSGGDNVDVVASVYKDHLHLSVSDTGIGIIKGDEERIFDRFYQSQQDTSQLSGGSGVGLALSKEIVDLYKGVITAANNVNGGATFTLKIPFEMTKKTGSLEEGEEAAVISKGYQPLTINGEKPRVLIVEDNQEMSQYIASILRPFYECSFAFDGFECLQKIQKERFDIISSDVMMPKMDGFTLKEKINQLERNKTLPFIFLTAKSLEEDKIFGLNLGVDDYISKPFNKNEYLTRIHNLLQNKKTRDELNDGFSEDMEGDEAVDRIMLKRAEQIVLKNIQNPNFKIKNLADGMNYSQRQLTRIIKRLSGLTNVNFILEIRLQKAYDLILRRKFSTISEVRYDVGIESASYFSKKFNERFGISPSEMMASQ